MQLEGLIAAAYTPFYADGSLNLAMIDKQADLFVETGVRGVFVGGTTGECHSLTVDERIHVAHKWCTVAKNRLAIGVHIGSNCVRDARTLALRAQVSGAQAIAATAPFFFRPTQVPDLVEYLAEIASAAPGVPFYYYDIPSMTGVQLPTAEIVRQAGERIPTFRGVKFTSYDQMTYLECLRVAEGRYSILYGHDEMLLGALSLGAAGAIGSTYNYAAPIYVKLWDAFKRNDLAAAREAQGDSVRMIRALIPFGVVRAGKTIMRWCGYDCGPVRSPLRNLTVDEETRLFEALQSIEGFARPLRRG